MDIHHRLWLNDQFLALVKRIAMLENLHVIDRVDAPHEAPLKMSYSGVTQEDYYQKRITELEAQLAGPKEMFLKQISLLEKKIAELEAERDYLKGQLLKCAEDIGISDDYLKTLPCTEWEIKERWQGIKDELSEWIKQAGINNAFAQAIVKERDELQARIDKAVEELKLVSVGYQMLNTGHRAINILTGKDTA